MRMTGQGSGRGGASNSKQRSISSFFAPKTKPAATQGADTRQTHGVGAGDPSPGSQSVAIAVPVSSKGSSRKRTLSTSQPAAAADDVIIIQEPASKRSRSEALVIDEPSDPPTKPIPARNPALAAKAQRKLVTNRDGEHVYDPTVGTATPATPGTTGAASQQPPGKGGAKIKYTPLEQQVVELKQKHPGVLLCVEVGYKFRMFGEDAEVGARVCNIYAFPDHNFLTCGFPVFRLPVYVRRLVNAGHKVGVVRQVETAALKSQSSSRNAPFERKLVSMFTAATLDAGQRADKAGEEQNLEEFAELDNAAVGTVQKFILFVGESATATTTCARSGVGPVGSVEVVSLLEDSSQGSGQQGVDGGQGIRSQGTGQVTRGSPACVTLLAVEPSTGDVQIQIPDSDDGSAAGGVTGSGSLETVLLSLAPAEVVVVEPVSAATHRLLQAYVSTVPGCRFDKLRGWGPGTAAKDIEQQLTKLYSDCAPGKQALAAVLSLPCTAQRVLAAAAQHLESFGLESVLRLNPVPRPSASHVASNTLSRGDGQEADAEAGTGTDTDQASSRALRMAGLQTLDRARAMNLGPNALRQLEVLSTSEGDHQYQGSLLHLLDRTYTAAGGRLLRSWVTAPLTDAALINSRLDAVEELAGVRGATNAAGPLAKLPDTLRRLTDLDRGLTRILHRTAPPAELVVTLLALKEVPTSLGLRYDHSSGELCELGQGQVASPLLMALLSAAAAPEAHRACRTMLDAIDTKAAKQNRTVDCLADGSLFEDVLGAKQAVQEALDALQALLPGLAKELGVRALDYVSIQNQGDWLIEVPVQMDKRVPRSWNRVCGTKKVGRYHPPSVQQGMLELAMARERLDATALTAYNRFLGSFVPYYASCKAASRALAELDAMCALAAVARTPGYTRPVVSSPASTAPHIIIRGGRHPMLDAQLSARAGAPGAGEGVAGGAVPNDVVLESGRCRAAVITGPNMGGKSCLLRQVALTAIMAQVGSFVPADSCRLTALDGVYTRMGASDNLLLGRSTFMEELGDASAILAHATNNSLVIMDELGRGTATHDGVAIAAATLSHLVAQIQCLTLFVTHYPEVAHMQDHRRHVQAFHMAYVRDDDGEEHNSGPMLSEAAQGATPAAACPEPHPPQGGAHKDGGAMEVDTAAPRAEAPSSRSQGTTARGSADRVPRITFLYKLQPGAADQSFGLNVAQMAGLPRAVVEHAAAKAAALLHSTEAAKVCNTTQHVVELLKCMKAASDSVLKRSLLQQALLESGDRRT